MASARRRALLQRLRRRVWLLPHEWFHYAVFNRYGVATIHYDPATPSKADVHATFADGTAPWAIRFGAVAPTVVYTLLAGLFDLAVTLQWSLLSPRLLVAYPALLLWLKWAHPSPADLSICYHAPYFAAKGNLTIDYEMSAWPKLGSGLALAVLGLYGPWVLTH